MTPLVKYRGSVEWHDGREPAYEMYDYYLAADVEAWKREMVKFLSDVAAKGMVPYGKDPSLGCLIQEAQRLLAQMEGNP
jgi:hypothetical protein